MKILIVEDDPDIAANLYEYLEGAGHTLDLASNGVTGLHLAMSQTWDALLLDLSLPGLDGLQLCRKLRVEARCDVPVLMLTARDTLDDKLLGFRHGADDYLVKPFSLKEVEARLGALVKRAQGRVTPAVLQCADIRLDPERLEVDRAGRIIKLSPKCLQLLHLLMLSPNRVLRRADLETTIWGEPQADSDTLRTHVYSLRRALTAGGEVDPIETCHGHGYRLLIPDAPR